MSLRFMLLILMFSFSCQTVRRDLSNSDPKIVGGKVTENFLPVGILSRDGKDLCTASLVASDRIVTAAHCVWPLRNEATYGFHVGTDFLRSKLYKIKSCEPHEHYDDRASNFDIAYCILSEPLLEIKPLTLIGPEQNISAGQELTIVGFGRNVSPGTGQDGGGGIKRMGTVRVTAVSSTKIKAEAKGTSSCNGDSGGPALIKAAEGEWQIAGVVSCGEANCESYGVYTRVDVFGGFVSGASKAQDFKDHIESCPSQSAKGICHNGILTVCTSDCFQAQKTTQDCRLLREGSCYQYAEQRGGVCIDLNWRRIDLKFREVSLGSDGFLSPVGDLDGEVIFDEENVHASHPRHRKIENGSVVELFAPGPHSVWIRRWHSSSAVGISKKYMFMVDKDSSVVEMISGKVPTFVKATLSLPPNENLYITGQSKLLGDWKKAFRMQRTHSEWLFQDLLMNGLEFKLVKVKSNSDIIVVDKDTLWEEGQNRKVFAPMTKDGIVMNISPMFR